MNTTYDEVMGGSPTPERSSALLYFIRMEFLKLLRMPTFSIPALLFPVLFFSMFGLPQVSRSLSGLSGGLYMLVAYGAYTVMSVSMFSFSVAVAVERTLGWHNLLRASPMKPQLYFLGKSIVTAGFGLLGLAILFAFCYVVGGIRPPVGTLLAIVGYLGVGLLPFSALGLVLGYSLGPSSVIGVANAIFLSLAFAAGIFLPYQLLPEIIQKAALVLPSYHLAQLGWNAAAGSGLSTQLEHLAWLLGYTIAFFLLARTLYQRASSRSAGQ